MRICNAFKSVSSSLTQVRTEGILTWRMPNQFNMAFDYATALICFSLLYIPCMCCFVFLKQENNVSRITYSLPSALLLHVRATQESNRRRQREEARIVISFIPAVLFRRAMNDGVEENESIRAKGSRKELARCGMAVEQNRELY